VNKNDLVTEVAEMANLDKADVARAVDAVFEIIARTLKQKDSEVRLAGFGTFVVSERKKSTGRNPRTGEEIEIPASRQPKFRAAKALKDAVN